MGYKDAALGMKLLVKPAECLERAEWPHRTLDDLDELGVLVQLVLESCLVGDQLRVEVAER